MADLEEEEDHESFNHDLLMKLKKTTEGLLAGQSVQGVWGTYGGLRRVCQDTEAILCHRIKNYKAHCDSDGSFWQFVKGLKWLSPTLAPVIDKLNRHSQAEKTGGIEAGRAWLRDSVQEHSLMTQLDILISSPEHLHYFYHDDAFLCQSDYVQAMRICFKAIELNKPALLTDINPHLLRSGRSSATPSRSSSLPATHVTIRGSHLPSVLSRSARETPEFTMGNKHSHLNVTYTSQLSSSNLSLSVDPSLGVTSNILQHKALSEPYFVSSLDSPRVLENLRRDPFSDAFRNNRTGNAFQSSRLSNLRLNEQSVNASLVDQSSPDSATTVDMLQGNSVPTSQVDETPQICVRFSEASASDNLDLGQTVNSSNSQDSDTTLTPVSIITETTSHSSFEDVTAEAERLQRRASTLSYNNPAYLSADQNSHEEGDIQIAAISDNSGPVPNALTTDFSASPLTESELGDKQISPQQTKTFELPSPWDHQNDVQLRRGFPKSINRESLWEFGSKSGSHISIGMDAAATLNSEEFINSNVLQGPIFEAGDHKLISQIEGATNPDFINTCASNDGVADFSGVPIYRNVPGTSSNPVLQHHRSCEPRLQGAAAANTGNSGMTTSEQNLTNPSNSGNALPSGTRPKIFSVKSDPSLSTSDPLLSPDSRTNPASFQYASVDDPRASQFSPGLYNPTQPWADTDLYRESVISPSSSPRSKNFSSGKRSSGFVYIPQPLTRGYSLDLPAMSPAGNLSHNAPMNKQQTSVPPSASASRKLGHKRWVSDTSTIQVEKHQHTETKTTTSTQPTKDTPTTSVGVYQAATLPVAGSHRRRSVGLETGSYHGTLTKPTEGQSLMSYLTSQDFNTCANLEKENAHFHISEALIAAFESMKWNRMMKKQEAGRQHSSSASSSDEEIHELRQRIRIRKREKMLEKGRPFPSFSDGQTDTATTSQSASSPVSSQGDFSFSSDSSHSEGETDGRDIDLSMSSTSQGNLSALRSSGLTLSMASLYSELELQRSNQQVEKNSSYEESGNPGSAESIAISLLRKFSEKHLPKASELKWLVSERDAPQRLLPLPSSIPVSPDDSDNTDLSRTRLRGNLEWAPPRAQIIFSVHPSEKRLTVMTRQNFRCAGCGMRVDPAFVKRYRYCEYLGKYFCQCCHTGETSVIPGRVLERWDFSRYPVSTFSHSLLEKMWKEPLFHVNTINPTLYKRVKGLESIREGRKQLTHLHSLLGVCKRDPRLIKELLRLPSHWITNDDAYSMEDFTQVKTGSMLPRIRSFISFAVSHVSDCQLCQGLGFICGMCQDPQVIFPFQLDVVVRCPVCQVCYHKECFIPDKCPKCIRLEARRKVQQEPLSPDSPDSGDNEESQFGNVKQAMGSSSTPVGSADTCR